jgi:hypothetical protein
MIYEKSFVLVNDSTLMALMLLEVRPQMLSHRLICFIFSVTYGTFNSIVLTMIEQMKSKLVFCVEVSSTIITSVIFRLMRRKMLFQVSWCR